MARIYDTPHRTNVVKTRLSDEELSVFRERLRDSGVGQSEFIRQAILRSEVRPLIQNPTLTAETLAELGELISHLGKMGSNLNQIARHLNQGGFFTPEIGETLYKTLSDMAVLKNDILKKQVLRLATIKHIASKNSNYGDAEMYLTFEHDEYRCKPIRDDHGNLVPRQDYRIETLLCGDDDFAIACMKANLSFGKNLMRGDIKTHHYIISFDPRDAKEHQLDVNRAQSLGVAFCKEHFPGHQALVCTHPDGHHHSGVTAQ